MLKIAVLVAVFGLSLSAPFTNINDIPKEYQSMVPKEAIDFLKDLTPNDKIALKEWAKGYGAYRNEQEAINSLKARSAPLGEKAEKLHNLIKEKVQALKPEAKAFATEIIDRVRRLQAQIVAGEKPSLDDLKSKASIALKKYSNLSEAAKADLDAQFPIINAIMKNEKLKKLANSYTGN